MTQSGLELLQQATRMQGRNAENGELKPLVLMVRRHIAKMTAVLPKAAEDFWRLRVKTDQIRWNKRFGISLG